jgi:hypothetical protein
MPAKRRLELELHGGALLRAAPARSRCCAVFSVIPIWFCGGRSRGRPCRAPNSPHFGVREVLERAVEIRAVLGTVEGTDDRAGGPQADSTHRGVPNGADGTRRHLREERLQGVLGVARMRTTNSLVSSRTADGRRRRRRALRGGQGGSRPASRPARPKRVEAKKRLMTDSNETQPPSFTPHEPTSRPGAPGPRRCRCLAVPQRNVISSAKPTGVMPLRARHITGSRRELIFHLLLRIAVTLWRIPTLSRFHRSAGGRRR